MSSSFILGIDTSNYKTSVAVVTEEGEILCNIQEFLTVKKGERGLRQQDAFFQHVMKIPELVTKALEYTEGRRPAAVSVSSKPRPVEGSYMPVFNAGVTAAKLVSSAWNVPLYTFSHQEGHIEAVKHNSPLCKSREFISFHFSGGTTEALFVKDGNISLAGGSKDLAMGQVIDRLGVSMGMDFPCGEEMDKAIEGFIPEEKNILTRIKVKDGEINLSGIETQCQRQRGTVADTELIYMVFQRLAEAISGICRDLTKKYNTKDFLFAGGVSSSRFIRKYLRENLKDLNLFFGDPVLSTDNAVGIAFLGGNKLWQ